MLDLLRAIAFFLLILTGVAASSAASAAAARQAALTGPIPATVERVVDGDTIRVTASIWPGQTINVSVRIEDVDAPELFRPKCPEEKALARRSKDFAAAFVGDGPVRLYEVRQGKYAGRVVARVENEHGEDLGVALTSARHAVRGARGDWCPG